MKRFNIIAIAAACVLSVASIPAFAQSPAKLKKQSGAEADCVYTDLTIVAGTLTVNCASDVVYTNGGTPPPAGGPYSLTVTTNPVNAGVVTSTSCATGSSGACLSAGAVVPAGSVTLTAAANSGYAFTGWSGVVCGGGQAALTCTFTIGANVTAVAAFTSTGSPPPPVPTGCTGLTPTTNYEARASIGPGYQSSYHYGKAGIIYSYPLPATSTGRGLFGTTGAPLTPGGINVEIAISRCPGDMNYYKTAEAKYLQFGTLKVPCGGTYNPESGGIKWGPVMVSSTSVCLTPTIATTPWYVNVRYVTGCEGGASCPIIYFWNPQ